MRSFILARPSLVCLCLFVYLNKQTCELGKVVFAVFSPVVRVILWPEPAVIISCSLPSKMFHCFWFHVQIQYFGHPMWTASSLERTLMLRKIEGRRSRGQQRMKLFGWYHRFSGHELGQILGDSNRQGSLAYCSPWGSQRVDMTWLLNNNNIHTHTHTHTHTVRKG